MTEKPRPKKSAIAIPKTEFLAEHGFTTDISETTVLEVVQITGTNTFITLVRKDERYYAFRGDGKNIEAKYETVSRKNASEYFQTLLHSAIERGESLSFVDL